MFLVTMVVSPADFKPSRLLALLNLRFSPTPVEMASCEYKYHLLSLVLNQMKGFLYSFPPDLTFSRNV